jgi:hypothetical protein
MILRMTSLSASDSTGQAFTSSTSSGGRSDGAASMGGERSPLCSPLVGEFGAFLANVGQLAKSALSMSGNELASLGQVGRDSGSPLASRRSLVRSQHRPPLQTSAIQRNSAQRESNTSAVRQSRADRPQCKPLLISAEHCSLYRQAVRSRSLGGTAKECGGHPSGVWWPRRRFGSMECGSDGSGPLWIRIFPKRAPQPPAG